MKQGLFAAASAAFLGLISACSITPGMRNDIDDGAAQNIEIVPITTQLVAELRNQSTSAEPTALPESMQAVRDAAASYHYRIGPGDVLSIIVWDHLELTNPTGQYGDVVAAGRLVASDGTIFYPNIGVIPVAGKTLGEVRTFISKSLARVIRDPQVDVKVAAFRSQRIYVTGEVKQPGVSFLDDQPKGVLDAINERGGFTENADRRRATLSREGVVHELDLNSMYARGNPAANILLRAGDVLNLADASTEKVFLLGELTREQTIPIQRGHMTLAEALSTAGGLEKSSADPKALFVFRASQVNADAGISRVFAMDLTRADSLLLAEQFELQARDVVYVGSTDFSKYNRVIGQLLPTITAIFQIDRLTSRR